MLFVIFQFSTFKSFIHSSKYFPFNSNINNNNCVVYSSITGGTRKGFFRNKFMLIVLAQSAFLRLNVFLEEEILKDD